MQEHIDSLNPQQKEVALCMEPCLVIAAPGSGKTKTLAVKAAYLLSKGQTVTAVTFTRDAALELRERILHLAGGEALPRLLVGTFHSIDLLMAFPKKVKSGMGKDILSRGFSKLTRSWEIVKESDRRSIVDRAIAQSGLAVERDEATSLIEELKAGYRAPESDEHRKLVNSYKSLLSRHGYIDFQDILLKTNEALSNGIISPLQTDHLMIDEFQDTDQIQFDWAMHHAKSGSVLTAVGDDDQSIYGFRRALGYAGMSAFAGTLHAQKIILGTNYRSHEEVLSPSAQLIRINQDRMDKDLKSFKGPGGSAQWDRFGDRVAEANECVLWAKAAMLNNQSVGVLARTNKRLDEIEAMCIKHEVPYTRSEGGSLLDTPEAAVFLSSARLLVRDHAMDLDRVLAWLQVPEDEISVVHAMADKKPLEQFDKKGVDALAASAETKKIIRAIVRRVAEWKLIVDSGGIRFALTGMFEMLKEPVNLDNRAVKTLSVVMEMLLAPLGQAHGLQELQARLDRIQSSSSKSKSKGNAESEVEPINKASLLTAHGSKGLEWDCVWMIGCEEGVFPDETASVQEERRLFFVAMTRARKHLMMSASGSKPLSAFIGESGTQRRPEH